MDGDGDDAPQKTLFPVTFESLQSILNQLGYGICFHDPKTSRVHFRREDNLGLSPRAKDALGGGLPDSAPKDLAVLKPDFVADGYEAQVYDVDYVVDLLNRLLGRPGGGGDPVKLLAMLSGEREKH